MTSATFIIETVSCFHNKEKYSELIGNGYTKSPQGYFTAEKTITVSISGRAVSYSRAIDIYKSLYARYGGQNLILNNSTKANILYRILCRKCGFDVRKADWFDTTAKRGGTITGSMHNTFHIDLY